METLWEEGKRKRFRNTTEWIFVEKGQKKIIKSKRDAVHGRGYNASESVELKKNAWRQDIAVSDNHETYGKRRETECWICRLSMLIQVLIGNLVIKCHANNSQKKTYKDNCNNRYHVQTPFLNKYLSFRIFRTTKEVVRLLLSLCIV